jgi:hypothetical protein
MRARVKGPLDPLFKQTPHGQVIEVARLVGVARQTIRRWQRKPKTIGPYWRMKLNLIALGRGMKPLFKER